MQPKPSFIQALGGVAVVANTGVVIFMSKRMPNSETCREILAPSDS